ncbi:MAG TPA: FAD-dependent oxidoreductase [Rhodothermales bacterium]|nr:FAD-dependent oxidoreductase [Rhodothermales bacterium]
MNPKRDRYDSIVVGGGFFGAYFAERLASKGQTVLLLEREKELLSRASLVNQARIHRGYHYPRSVLTGFRSAVNFARFITDLNGCVSGTYESYYAIARRESNVTSLQFKRFCATIGAPLHRAAPRIQRLFNQDLIEAVFAVEECVFDAFALRQEMRRRLDHSRVEVILSTEVARVESGNEGPCVYLAERANLSRPRIQGVNVFLCCYALLNTLLLRSHLPAVPIKHELTEMALVQSPEELREIAITVMCGPFFSMMPYPTRDLHTLSHVRYTPHFAWTDSDRYEADQVLDRHGRSRFPEMIRDSSRYLPLLSDSSYVESLWEVKAVLPQSEMNDSRPILMLQPQPGIFCILGGKIDNVYDVWDLYDGAEARAS